jgi:hypothetical protein
MPIIPVVVIIAVLVLVLDESHTRAWAALGADK